MSEKMAKQTHTQMFDTLAKNIQTQQSAGSIQVPSGYSLPNAIKGAYLIIKEVTDKNKKPALEVCTQESIYMSLLKMAVLGLNPLTQQCYFTVYGNKLQCGVEYTANIMIAKRDCGMVGQPVFDVIREGEEYEVGRDELGRKFILKHTSDFKTKSGEIIGAYCRINLPDGDFVFKDYSMDQIKKSWAQGYGYKDNGSGVHGKFGEEMAIKTAINKTIGRVVRSSTNMPASFVGSEFDETTQTIDVTHEEIKQETISIPETPKQETIEVEKEAPKVEVKKEEPKEPVQATMPLGADWD